MLLVRPVPKSGESSQAYLLRLVESNELGSPTRLCAIYSSSAGACGTAQVLRGPVSWLRHLSSADPGGLPIRYWNTRRPRYCPACLQAQAIWPALWQLVFYVSCHVHGTDMVETCPGCDRPLRWTRGSLTACECGADLGDAPTCASSASQRQMSSEIAAAWADGQLPTSKEQADAGIEELLHRIWLLGAYRLGLTKRAQKLGDLHCLDAATNVVDAAAAALQNWPAGFFALLDDASAKFGKDATPRLTDRFGGLYRELFAPRRRQAFADLRAGFESYVLQRWPGQLAARNRRLTPSAIKDHVWVPVAKAAKDLRWRPKRVRSAIARGLLVGRLQVRPSGRISGVVHRDSLAELVADAGTWVDLTTVCQHLHIGKKAAKQLVECGKLQAVAGPSVDGHPVWQFRAEAVHFLRSSLT